MTNEEHKKVVRKLNNTMKAVEHRLKLSQNDYRRAKIIIKESIKENEVLKKQISFNV